MAHALAKREGARRGEVLLWYATSFVALAALAAAAFDLSAAMTEHSLVTGAAALCKDEVAARQNEVKFSADPHAEISGVVFDALAESGYTGKATVYTWEVPQAEVGNETDRYIGVRVALETRSASVFAGALVPGAQDATRVAQYVDFVIHPYATARVWRPSDASAAEAAGRAPSAEREGAVATATLVAGSGDESMVSGGVARAYVDGMPADDAFEDAVLAQAGIEG